ncbi:MAG: succinylglutamate desuccinylase/aspartoacylase family protein [Candidatus Aminicenantes bacterium]|nr:MAG: succinylglutamate desuccinylase/aspartoacylase family protein [Candidatus Aminicenantes bacterium]
MLRSDFRRVFFFLIAVFVIHSFSFGEEENIRFVVGDIVVEPGEVKSGYLPVPEKKGIGTRIPVTIMNGSKPGKVLALVAGVHGYEYPPILALYRLKDTIDPRSLSGTLIFVHIANLQSFQKRIIYYNPNDWKNLNRVFPGDPEGTISQRVAYVLKNEIVDRCDYLIDLHCGDGNEALIPYTYWMISGNKELDELSKKMALAFGIKYIIIDQSRTKDLTDSKYLGNTAVLFKIPAITTESGYLGKTDEESIVRNTKGILSVMRLFGMIQGEPEMVSDPIWIDKYEVVYSKEDGLFYPLTEMGYFAREGEKVGYLTDYLGNVIQELHAPFTGIVLYIIATPPANKGEPLFEVGSVLNK